MELTSPIVDRFRVAPGHRVHLNDWATKWAVPQGMEELNKAVLKQQAADFVAQTVAELAGMQELLWVDGRYSLLLVFQGPDASGKDSTIRHVTSGMSPAGVRVVSFKEPTPQEIRRNYLWRYVAALPEQGYIIVFNRSYYEEVTVVRVNPGLLKSRATPERPLGEGFWKERYEDINLLERQMVRNGTIVLKFFLHISKEEQRKRLLERLQDPEKQWKFASSDLAARDRWDDYQIAYEEALSHTSTEWAPWWIMPADRKWAMRALVAQVILTEVRKLNLRYPPIDDETRAAIEVAMRKLQSEN